MLCKFHQDRSINKKSPPVKVSIPLCVWRAECWKELQGIMSMWASLCPAIVSLPVDVALRVLKRVTVWQGHRSVSSDKTSKALSQVPLSICAMASNLVWTVGVSTACPANTELVPFSMHSSMNALEPPGLDRGDGSRPDGIAFFPFSGCRSLVWAGLHVFCYICWGTPG